MRIPPIIPKQTAVNTVRVIRKGKKIVKQAVHQTELLAMDDQLKNKAISTIMMATSFMPQMNTKIAKISAEAVEGHDLFIKNTQKISSTTKEKFSKTITASKNLKIKLETTKPKYHEAFNDLLLKNEKHKNPLNNKAIIFDKKAKVFFRG